MDSFFKKSLSLGLIFACTLSSVNTAFAASKGMINADDVNIRTQASTSSEVIKKLSNGVTVTVIGSADGWYKLSTAAGGVAYVKQDYVTITESDAVVADSFVNVRSNPSITSSVIGVVSQGETIKVTGSEGGDWYSVDFNGQKGDVYGDYFSGTVADTTAVDATVGGVTAKAEKPAETASFSEEETPASDVYAVINSTSLNLREEPNTDSDVIDCYENGYAFVIVGVSGEWIKVMNDEGQIGYVKAEFVDLKNGTKPDNKKYPTVAERRAPVNYDDEAPATQKAADVIAYAKEFIGTPYVYGGTDLLAGVDCSGFIYSVYQDFGITLDRRSRDQINDGERVAKEDLRPGDLVFFNTGGDSVISHVGMYIGNGEYIHSTNGAANGVTISDLNSDYALNTYVGAARILD